MPSSRLLQSSRDVLFPPISIMLAMRRCPHLMDSLNNGLKYKNPKAIEHIGNLLSDLCVDDISAAFIKAVEEDMICRCCYKQIKFIDELCICPESAGRCHCTGCCDKRKIVAYDWQMYSYATMDQEEPMYFAVGEPVFPKFSEVLKMNQYDGLAVMMEQLAVNAAAYGGLSEANECLLANIQNNLDDIGLNNMMDALIKALGSKFICNKCKKQLELDDICYCKDAKAKCHCNSRICCTVTLKERGKFN
uniref:MYND-type domain-containing protein n=1 Tax=Globodera pallida TaxID=36090 RepID=A0A183CCS6_GLOPA